MKQSLLEEFLESNPNFILEIEQLSGTNKGKFIRGFKKEKNKTNFLSKISELRFAEFLERESINYIYEPIFEGKKPDFKINFLTNSSAYFDVKRFNISDSDKLNDRKLYDLAERLKTIQKPYYVHIEQIKKKLEFDLDLSFNVIKKWIFVKTLKAGDVLNYENQFNIEITNTNGIKNYILYSYNVEKPKINQSKIASDILSKIRIYQQVIINKGIPFFVGIDLTFDTLKDPNDYWVQFLGGASLNIGTKEKSFQLGEFFVNSEFDGLTGLLIRYNNQFYWLNNPRNSNQIEFRTAKSTYE